MAIHLWLLVRGLGTQVPGDSRCLLFSEGLLTQQSVSLEGPRSLQSPESPWDIRNRRYRAHFCPESPWDTRSTGCRAHFFLLLPVCCSGRGTAPRRAPWSVHTLCLRGWCPVFAEHSLRGSYTTGAGRGCDGTLDPFAVGPAGQVVSDLIGYCVGSCGIHRVPGSP